MARHILIGITGTPASGKTFFAASLSRATGIEAVEINSVIKTRKSFYTEAKNGEKVARLKPLERRLRELTSDKDVILVGHLAQEMDLPYDCIVITRASIPLLARRLRARGYGLPKIRENLTCEAIDCCAQKAEGLTRNVFEVETREEKAEMIRSIVLGTWRKGGTKLRKQKNKMPEFESFIRRNRRMGL